MASSRRFVAATSQGCFPICGDLILEPLGHHSLAAFDIADTHKPQLGSNNQCWVEKLQEPWMCQSIKSLGVVSMLDIQAKQWLPLCWNGPAHVGPGRMRRDAVLHWLATACCHRRVESPQHVRVTQNFTALCPTFAAAALLIGAFTRPKRLKWVRSCCGVGSSG
jgi:hypothetical protein